ncbi:MAG TPA: AtpZ/AtpI family protein [Massilibacterium sp.]|nr:AtpZ/AtpI family protein [Massilibacterium sp.]
MSKSNKNPLHGMAIVSAIVSQLTGSILIGIFGGKWLDDTFDTEPLFLILGLLLGLAVGVTSVILSLKKFLEEEKEE